MVRITLVDTLHRFVRFWTQLNCFTRTTKLNNPLRLERSKKLTSTSNTIHLTQAPDFPLTSANFDSKFHQHPRGDSIITSRYAVIVFFDPPTPHNHALSRLFTRTLLRYITLITENHEKCADPANPRAWRNYWIAPMSFLLLRTVLEI